MRGDPVAAHYHLAWNFGISPLVRVEQGSQRRRRKPGCSQQQPAEPTYRVRAGIAFLLHELDHSGRPQRYAFASMRSSTRP